MEEIKFETALIRLESIVDELEKGELGIDKSLKLFKKGTRRKIASFAALLVAVFFVAAPPVHAAPGEGAYLGAFFGHGGGHVNTKLTSRVGNGGTLDMPEGGLGLEGIQWGGWAGYGLRLSQLYAGFEIEGGGSEEKWEFTSSRNIPISATSNLTSITAEKRWVAGGAFRLGYYINPNTLFALKGGFNVTEFNVKWVGVSDTMIGGGPSVGASVEGAVSDNLSLRLEYVVTDYLSADTETFGGDTVTSGDGQASVKISGMDYAGRLGLVYNF